MSLSLNGSSQYLALGAQLIAYPMYPFTMAVWIKPVDHLNIYAVTSHEGSGDSHILQARGITNNCAAGSYASAWGIAYTTTDYTDGTWQHLCGVFTGAASRACFLDGGSKGTDTTSQTPVNGNEFLVGIRTIGSPTQHFYGKMAHVAVWNVALSDSEVAQLAAGANPTAIQAANLVAYYPLVDSGVDFQGGTSLTEYGSPTWDTADFPSITEVAPSSVTITGDTAVYTGYTMSLTAVASGGTGGYSYQWNKDGSPISGATSNVYTVSDVTDDDAGAYTCTVTNNGGSATSSIATVTVSSSSLALVMGGVRSSGNESVWGFNEAGVQIWAYDTGANVISVQILPSGNVLVAGVSGDNGDGNGTRNIWKLAPDGSYVSGGVTSGSIYSMSVDSSGNTVSCGGTADLYWTDSDFTVTDQETQTVDGAYACIFDDDGNTWYGYQNNVSGPDYYIIRKLDSAHDEVFDEYIQVSDNERINALAQASTGKVFSWHPGEATLRRHAEDGAGGFQGEFQTTMTGWGTNTVYQCGMVVDQSDSDQVYVIGDGFGVVSYAGSELYNHVGPPSKETIRACALYGESGKVFILSSVGDGGNLYVWDEDTDTINCVVDLDGPDEEDALYAIDVAPSVTWAFPASEKLDEYTTETIADQVNATDWVAETFTLSEYKKPGRVSLWVSRQYETSTMTISLQAVDGDGKPDGVDICSGSWTAVNAGADSTRYIAHIFFSTTPILVPGTYAIVIRANGDMSFSVDGAGGGSGDFWESADGGSSWTAGSASLKFELWGDESGYVLPSFDSQSGSQSLYVDQTPTPLSVTVSGTPTPTLQWYADGSPITGETGSSYSPPAQSSPTSISYTCRATNVLGYTDTTPMVITWSAAPLPSDPVTYNILNLQLDIDRT